MARRKSRYSGIGGQAVLEGVMMMGPESYALSVRKPNGEIDVSVTPFQTITAKHKGLDIPIVRGVLNFIESLYVGISTILSSSFNILFNNVFLL